MAKLCRVRAQQWIITMGSELLQFITSLTTQYLNILNVSRSSMLLGTGSSPKAKEKGQPLDGENNALCSEPRMLHR